MDHVPPANIHVILACDINTKFNDRSYADWSKSNYIAYVTLDGIYIMKPQLDFQHGPFEIQIIKNPNVRFKHHQLSKEYPFFDSVWQTLSQIQFMEVFSDPALTTHVDKLSLDSYPRRFRLAKWSPPLNIFPKQCYLATITVDYQLVIYFAQHGWIPIADLSLDYDKFWLKDKTSQTNIQAETSDFNKVSKVLHSLSFCDVCWFNHENSDDDPYLLAATITGDIVIWKLEPTTGEKQAIQFQLVTILKSDIQYITSMKFLSYFLFISSRNGQISLYNLSEIFINFKKLRGKKSLEIQPLSPVSILWNKDNIEVQDFYIQPLAEGLHRIILSKSTNICWAIIGCNKSEDGLSTILSLSDSYSAIDGLDSDVSLHQTPATWLKPAGDRRAVFIADDGSFFQLHFNDENRQDSIPEFDAISTGKIDLTRMVPRGLCTSPNGQLISMCSALTLQYEPAKIPAPTKIILIPTKNDWRSFVENVDKLRDENWLQSHHVRSPMDICDMIDYVISYYPYLDSDRFNELYKLLRNEIGTPIITPQNHSQYVKLKILSFILLRMLNHRQTRLIETDGFTIVQHEIYDRLIHHHIDKTLFMICEFLRTMSKSGDYSLKKLNEEQTNSVSNIYKWLTMNPSRNALKMKYDHLFNKFNLKDLNVEEQCPICKNDVHFDSLTLGICTNGHAFHRCSRSLIIIDVNSNKDLRCEHCLHHYRGDLVWPSQDLWLCIYCQ